jgi:hypothetical protein
LIHRKHRWIIIKYNTAGKGIDGNLINAVKTAKKVSDFFFLVPLMLKTGDFNPKPSRHMMNKTGHIFTPPYLFLNRFCTPDMKRT